MPNEDCKAAVRRLWEQGFNQADAAVAPAICHPRHVTHDPGAPDLPAGPDGLAQWLEAYRDAMPGARVRVEALFGQGDKVVARWSAEAPGPMGARSPRRLEGTCVHRFENGRLIETWSRSDAIAPAIERGARVS
ncbi:MAG: ester cyclase [Candidatus Sericytochromatia bacterium]